MNHFGTRQKQTESGAGESRQEYERHGLVMLLRDGLFGW